MANITGGFGAALVFLGLGGYLATGAESVTALIPAVFGLLLVALARAARRGAAAWTLPAAALVAAMGLLGVLPNLPAVFAPLTGGEVVRPVATAVQGLMGLLCGALLALYGAAWRRQRGSNKGMSTSA